MNEILEGHKAHQDISMKYKNMKFEQALKKLDNRLWLNMCN
jgi:hypothetical protein